MKLFHEIRAISGCRISYFKVFRLFAKRKALKLLAEGFDFVEIVGTDFSGAKK